MQKGGGGRAAPVALALDLATFTGWAIGPLDRRPRHGAWQLRGKTPGERYGALYNALADLITLERPASITFEAAIPRSAGADGAKAGILLMGFVAIVELVAFDQGRIPTFTEGVPETRKKILGRGGGFGDAGPKPVVMAWCRAHGFDPADDNAADALVLWHRVQQERGFTPAGKGFAPGASWVVPAR